MKRMFLSLAVGLLLLGLVPAKSSAKVIVGLSSVNVAFLPVYVTEAKGFFKDEGLDVLLVLCNAGATNLQALIGGDVQIMGSAFVETIGGRAAGIDIKKWQREYYGTEHGDEEHTHEVPTDADSHGVIIAGQAPPALLLSVPSRSSRDGAAGGPRAGRRDTRQPGAPVLRPP